MDILVFMLSLCEGYNRDMLTRIGKNIPAAVLEQIVIKLMKKIYVREQLRAGHHKKYKNFKLLSLFELIGHIDPNKIVTWKFLPGNNFTLDLAQN